MSSSIRSITALAATEVTGLPPKVEICSPEVFAISGRVMVMPTGTPLPRPLAEVMMSGVTSQCSMPNHFFPVRPQAVCTSSLMKSPPYFLTILNTILKYSGGGVINPPSP